MSHISAKKVTCGLPAKPSLHRRALEVSAAPYKLWIVTPEMIELEKEIGWDGEHLSVWAITPKSRVRCDIPRETIHSIWLYSDALSREIARDREEIIERIRPSVIAKVAAAAGPSVRLQPSDLADI